MFCNVLDLLLVAPFWGYFLPGYKGLFVRSPYEGAILDFY